MKRQITKNMMSTLLNCHNWWIGFTDDDDDDDVDVDYHDDCNDDDNDYFDNYFDVHVSNSYEGGDEFD